MDRPQYGGTPSSTREHIPRVFILVVFSLSRSPIQQAVKFINYQSPYAQKVYLKSISSSSPVKAGAEKNSCGVTSSVRSKMSKVRK